MKRLKVSYLRGLQELLRDHLLRDRPKFRMVPGLQGHVGDSVALLDMSHTRP
jgi:hypothetical protein